MEEGKLKLHRHTNLDEAKLKKVFEFLSNLELEIIQRAFSILKEGVKECLLSLIWIHIQGEQKIKLIFSSSNLTIVKKGDV